MESHHAELVNGTISTDIPALAMHPSLDQFVVGGVSRGDDKGVLEVFDHGQASFLVDQSDGDRSNGSAARRGWRAVMNVEAPVTSAAFDPSGSLLAVGMVLSHAVIARGFCRARMATTFALTDKNSLRLQENGKLALIDYETYKLILTVKLVAEPIHLVEFNLDGDHLALASSSLLHTVSIKRYAPSNRKKKSIRYVHCLRIPSVVLSDFLCSFT